MATRNGRGTGVFGVALLAAVVAALPEGARARPDASHARAGAESAEAAYSFYYFGDENGSVPDLRGVAQSWVSRTS